MSHNPLATMTHLNNIQHHYFLLIKWQFPTKANDAKFGYTKSIVFWILASSKEVQLRKKTNFDTPENRNCNSVSCVSMRACQYTWKTTHEKCDFVCRHNEMSASTYYVKSHGLRLSNRIIRLIERDEDDIERENETKNEWKTIETDKKGDKIVGSCNCVYGTLISLSFLLFLSFCCSCSLSSG